MTGNGIIESVLSDKITLKNAPVTSQFVDYLIESWIHIYELHVVEKSREKARFCSSFSFLLSHVT